MILLANLLRESQSIYNSKIWIERHALFCKKNCHLENTVPVCYWVIVETKQLNTEGQVTVLLELRLMNKVLCVPSRHAKFSHA